MRLMLLLIISAVFEKYGIRISNDGITTTWVIVGILLSIAQDVKELSRK